MANPDRTPRLARRLHDHEVDPERERWHDRAVGEDPALAEALGTAPDSCPLLGVDGLLGQPEVAAAPRPDLEDDEARRRCRVDCHDVQLGAADVDVEAQDRPAGRSKALGHEPLGGIARLL
jgi:hypothetical protein